MVSKFTSGSLGAGRQLQKPLAHHSAISPKNPMSNIRNRWKNLRKWWGPVQIHGLPISWVYVLLIPWSLKGNSIMEKGLEKEKKRDYSYGTTSLQRMIKQAVSTPASKTDHIRRAWLSSTKSQRAQTAGGLGKEVVVHTNHEKLQRSWSILLPSFTELPSQISLNILPKEKELLHKLSDSYFIRTL